MGSREHISSYAASPCSMWSCSATRHSKKVNVPCFNTSQAGQYSIYLPWKDSRLSWPDIHWLSVLQPFCCSGTPHKREDHSRNPV